MRSFDRFQFEEVAGFDLGTGERPESGAGLDEETLFVQSEMKREDPIQQGTRIPVFIHERRSSRPREM